MAKSDTLTITSNGKAVDCWVEFSVTRGIEVMPSGFVAKVTEASSDGAEHALATYQPFEAKLGDELVITGYLDDKTSYSAAGVHGVSISGASKCQDLVDCSAEILTMINGATPLSLAEMLAAPYGVKVSSKAGPGDKLETVQAGVGETPFDLIERYATYSGFLVYDHVDGNLVLARLAEGKMASGFVHGENVETISRSDSARQRYSDYEIYWQAGQGTNDPVLSDTAKAVAKDEGVPRNRKLKLASDLVLPYVDPRASALIVAGWQMMRRWGRSQQVRLTCSSWRDSEGKLWAPNHLVSVHAPRHGLVDAEWLIVSVTYNKGLQGTTADLLLMPKEAFTVQLTNPFGTGIAGLNRAQNEARESQGGTQQ